ETTSKAFMFSSTCSGRLAPVITVLTFGFFKHQARASCANVQPMSLAIICNFLTFSIFCGVITDSFNQSYPCNVAREPEGIPLLYLPVSRPDASGLQIVVPNPISR